MKTDRFLGCCILALLLISCEKADKDPETNLSEKELQRPISDSQRLKVIEDWQAFRKESGNSLLSAQEKLDQLEAKLNVEESKENGRLQRIYSASAYRLDNLKYKLLRQGIKFRNGIGHFTNKDVLKNESWRTGFKAKLTALHAELDKGLEPTPK